MYLTDLTFIDEGNSDIIQGMVNFSKCMMISDVLREIQLYQQTKYNQKMNPLFKVCVSVEAEEEICESECMIGRVNMNLE